MREGGLLGTPQMQQGASQGQTSLSSVYGHLGIGIDISVNPYLARMSMALQIVVAHVLGEKQGE